MRGALELARYAPSSGWTDAQSAPGGAEQQEATQLQMAQPVAAAVDSSPPFRPSSQRLVIPSSCCSAPPGAAWASVHPLLGAYLASSSAPLTLSHGSVVPVGRNRGVGFCSLEPWTAGHHGYVWLLCLPDGKLTGLAASRPNT